MVMGICNLNPSRYMKNRIIQKEKYKALDNISVKIIYKKEK
jgi:hypothetical protein